MRWNIYVFRETSAGMVEGSLSIREGTCVESVYLMFDDTVLHESTFPSDLLVTNGELDPDVVKAYALSMTASQIFKAERSGLL